MLTSKALQLLISRKVHLRNQTSSRRFCSDFSDQKTDNNALRTSRLEALKDIEKYPHKFVASTNIKKYVKEYEYLNNFEKHNEEVSLCGVISSTTREMSNKLKFVNIMSEGKELQLKLSASCYNSVEDFYSDSKCITRGDRIGKAGHDIVINNMLLI